MPNDIITTTQHCVLALLAEGKSIAEAAETIGVHRNTLPARRTPQPSFIDSLDPLVPKPEPIPAEVVSDRLPEPIPGPLTIVLNPVLQRAPPRNGPCPCGSGIKHKKCCGNPAVSFVMPVAA